MSSLGLIRARALFGLGTFYRVNIGGSHTILTNLLSAYRQVTPKPVQKDVPLMP